MSVTFRPATREKAPVIIMLFGASGSGKTYSALTLARGLAGPTGKVAVIDTEAGRATHYVGQFQFDLCDLKPPFTPAAYRDAIGAADDAGYDVVVVDSFSHEHAGDGGILDMHEAELQRMAGNDYAKREACKMAAWIRPKGEHKRMMSRFLQCRCHIVMCFRAEERIRMEKVDGKMKIVPIGWQPIAEKNMPYEATASFLLTPDAPGVPKPLKLQAQHRPFFNLDRPISEECGIALAKWARGGVETTPEPAAAQSIYDDIVAFARSTDDAAGLRTAWTTDTNVGVLKQSNAALYADAKKIVQDRLKELSA